MTQLKKEDGIIQGIERGSIINVQGYKHDGTLYRQWNGVKVLEVNPHEIVLYMFKTKVIEKSGQRWVVREPIIWFFPVSEWFNTTALIRNSGVYYYTNLASPPIFEEGTLKFIDYDLDVKCYPEQPIKLVDKNEFKLHSEQMKYPENLINLIDKEARLVIEMMSEEDGHFNPEVISFWIQELIENKLLGKKKIKKMDM